MKRSVLLLVVLMLSIPVIGCGGDAGSGGTTKGVPRAEDPNLPAEVREYEAQNAKRLADLAEKKARARAGKSASKKP
jgi:hypothetical protein